MACIRSCRCDIHLYGAFHLVNDESHKEQSDSAGGVSIGHGISGEHESRARAVSQLDEAALFPLPVSPSWRDPSLSGCYAGAWSVAKPGRSRVYSQTVRVYTFALAIHVHLSIYMHCPAFPRMYLCCPSLAFHNDLCAFL